MLTRLSIQNYAIIEELSVVFAGGLNIITGETGAGKSILMGALNLILGQRAEANALRTTEKKCVVEGCFKISAGKRFQNFFSDNDLEMEEEIILRREITANGKSRAFINDTPVNLGQLKMLSLLLVDLHQQFDTLELNTAEFQCEILDAYAENKELILSLKNEFVQYRNKKQQLEALKQDRARAALEQDYHQFLFDELNELALTPGEPEQLELELKLLNNAEKIKQQLAAVFSGLSDADDALLPQLKALQQRLKPLLEYHNDIEPLSSRMQAALIELQDVAEELQSLNENVICDEERIEFINGRLSTVYKLFKKHNVNDATALLNLLEELRSKLEKAEDMGAAIDQTEKETRLLHEACLITARQISVNRNSVLKAFAEKINKLLAQVGMPNARLKIILEQVELGESGIDEPRFLFDANKSGQFAALGRVASGGELSRLMLSIKSLVANKLELPTLIFDEIDSGISGEAAKQVGIIMKSLASEHQIISITHQPQIAARADAHYFVFKEVRDNRIVTGIRELRGEERIVAVAKMMGGEKPTAAALANAKEMISM